MARRFKDLYEESLPERLPIDVLPYSNGEFIPPDPTPEQKAIMKIAWEDCTEAAKRHGLSRRRFLQTSAAYAICMNAINKVMGGGYAVAADECGLHTGPLSRKGGQADIPLEYPGAQMNNLPGEFIMDLQTHHVDDDFFNEYGGPNWRQRNPGEQAFFAAVFGGSQCKSIEIDPIQCIGRFHYLKELFLDSSTNVTVLSAVPYSPDGQPLPIEESANTAGIIRSLAGGTRRTVIHRFVMPNRGSMGTTSNATTGVDPLFWPEERDLMEYTAAAFGGADGHFRAWKVYTPWGDVPYSSGWWLDDPVGRKFIQHAIDLSASYNVPALICAHKGFALPTFEQTKAATRDVGIVAKAFWDLDTGTGATFIIYHSGYDGDSIGIGGPFNQGESTAREYPGETLAPSINRGVDNFITALRENGWSARHFATGGQPGVPLAAGEGNPNEFANVPNVYAELGSVWSAASSSPIRAARLLTKLVHWVGPQRIVWGTDCLWSGSPQPQIKTLRAFNMRAFTVDGTPSDQVPQTLPNPNPPPSQLPNPDYVPTEIRNLALKYNMKFGLDTDRFDPTKDTLNASHYSGSSEAQRRSRSIRNGILGRNAAGPYRVDPDATLQAIACDDVQRIREEYLLSPSAQHRIHGPRTRRELFAMLRNDPWHRGARRMQNERGFLKTIG